MKRIVLYLLPFLCLADGMTTQQFNELKSDIINELSAVSQSYANAVQQMNMVYENGLDQYQYLTHYASQYPSDRADGMVAGAQSMMVYFTDFQYIRNDMQSNITSLGNAINMVNALSAPSNSVVDLSPVIDAIHSNTYQIVSSVSVGVNDITNSIALNVAQQISRADVAISNLQVIVEILSNADLSGGGSSGGGSTDVSTIEDRLSDIIDILSDILNTEHDIAIDVSTIASFIQWCLDENNPFLKYLTLAHTRLDSPDVSLSADLALMWQYCLEEISNIVYKADGFRLQSQIFPVVNDSSVHLSNEGLIGLQNLAMNQRQYLCSVAMLNELKGLNATNNLAWITNYLSVTQSPFYEFFKAAYPNSYNNPYSLSTGFAEYTNFLSRSHSSRANLFLAYQRYVNVRTNIFDRIETQLLTLNGLIPLGHEKLDDFESAISDEENNDRLIRYSTNNLVAVSESFAGVTNTVSFVLNEYMTAINSIWPDNLGTTTEITIMPSISFGGIQMDHIHLTYGDIESVGDAIRTVCQAIYWFFGLFFAFHFWRGILRVLGSVVVSLQKLLGLVLT